MDGRSAPIRITPSMKGRPRVRVEPCKFCNKQFKRQEHLDRHLRTHTQEKPFGCVCGRLFSRQDLLARHRRLAQCDSSVDSGIRPLTVSCSGGLSLSEAVASMGSTFSRKDAHQRAPTYDVGMSDRRAASGAVKETSIPDMTESDLYAQPDLIESYPLERSGPQDNVASLTGGLDVPMTSLESIVPPLDAQMATPDLGGPSLLEFNMDILSSETNMISNYLTSIFPMEGDMLPVGDISGGYMLAHRPGYSHAESAANTGYVRQLEARTDAQFVERIQEPPSPPLQGDTPALRRTATTAMATCGVRTFTGNANDMDSAEEENVANEGDDTPNTTTHSAEADTTNSLDASLAVLDGMWSADPWMISPATYARLVALVERRVTSKDSATTQLHKEAFQLPSRHVLSRYVKTFVRGFHPHLPFLHLGTTRLDRMSPMLLLTLAATGSFYGFEHTHGYAMYGVAKNVILQALEQRRQTRTAHLLPRFPRYAEMLPPGADAMVPGRGAGAGSDGQGNREGTVQSSQSSSRPTDEPVDRSLLQSLLVLLLTMSWLDEPLMEDALAMSSQLVELLRDALKEGGDAMAWVREECKTYNNEEEVDKQKEQRGEHGYDDATADDEEWDVSHQGCETDHESDWRRWGRREERLRTLYSAYFVLNILTICFEVPHPLSIATMDLVLPSREAEFAAPTRAAWQQLRRRRSEEEEGRDARHLEFHGTRDQQRPSLQREPGRGEMRPRFLPCLQQLLSGACLEKDAASREYGNYMLIQTLLVHIMREHQVLAERPAWFWSSSGSSPGTASPSLPPDIMALYADALNAWQAGWGISIDTSLLDPSSYVPMAFNATAMLRLAHAQLVLGGGEGFGAAGHGLGSGMGGKKTWTSTSCLLGVPGNLRCRNPQILATAFPGRRTERNPGEGREVGAERMHFNMRSPHVSQAVMHAIYALLIPVRVGIPFVARGRTGHWSVQHALSTFPCARLLAHWLDAVYVTVEAAMRNAQTDTRTEDRTEGCLPGLRHDEQRLLEMAERLIEETHLAGSLACRDAYPQRIRQLAVAALRLWADTCKGIQVYEIVHVVGASLNIAAAVIEGSV